MFIETKKYFEFKITNYFYLCKKNFHCHKYTIDTLIILFAFSLFSFRYIKNIGNPKEKAIYIYWLKFKENEHCLTNVNSNDHLCLHSEILREKINKLFFCALTKKTFMGLWVFSFAFQWLILCSFEWIGLHKVNKFFLWFDVYNYFLSKWKKNCCKFFCSEIIVSMIITLISFNELNNWKSKNNATSLFVSLRMNKV